MMILEMLGRAQVLVAVGVRSALTKGTFSNANDKKGFWEIGCAPPYDD